jgi:hypothetical protein
MKPSIVMPKVFTAIAHNGDLGKPSKENVENIQDVIFIPNTKKDENMINEHDEYRACI